MDLELQAVLLLVKLMIGFGLAFSVYHMVRLVAKILNIKRAETKAKVHEYMPLVNEKSRAPPPTETKKEEEPNIIEELATSSTMVDFV
jgi:hypothetical protein